MKDYRINRDGFEIYKQEWNDKITLEIDYEHDGIESYCQGNISLSYKEVKEIYEYMTKHLIIKDL